MSAPAWKETPWGQELETEHGILRLERRPPYCDRGAFLAHVEPKHDKACAPCNVDAHDLFPRFYYDEGRAKLELDAFMRARKWIAEEDASARSPFGRGTYGELAALVMDRANASAVLLLVKGGAGRGDALEVQADHAFVRELGGPLAFRAYCYAKLQGAAFRILEEEAPIDTSDPDPGP